MNVDVAELAVRRYYTTVSQQRITDALATLIADDTSDHNTGQTCDPVQVYRGRTDDQRRLLNYALFHRLYLAADRIINHEPRPTTPLT